MKKRFLASLLSLVMLLTMLPVTAFAATGDAYTIKFVAGTGATGTMADQTVAKAESGATPYTIPDSTFVAPTGKVFGEWTITAPADTADLKVENGVLSIPDTLETSQAITLTATWRDPANNEYVINFEAGEGGTGTMTSQPVMKTTDADTEYSLPECAFEAPEGKEFKAWAVTAPTDGGLTIADGKLTIPAAVTVATTITLTATWDTASTPPSGQEITEVAVTLDTADLTVDSALPEAGTDTEGATVSTKWYTAAGEEVKTTTFAAAGTYTAKITVAADTGYTLADTVTYKLNDVNTSLTGGVLETTATVAAAPAGEDKEIMAVDVTITTTDLTIDSTLPEARTTTTGASVSTKWYKGADEVKTATFETAGDYTAKITVTANTGYKLADTATYKLNNADAQLKGGVLEANATVAAAGTPAEPAITGVTSKTSGVNVAFADGTITLSGSLTAPTSPATTGTVALTVAYTDETGAATSKDVTVTLTYDNTTTPATWKLPNPAEVVVEGELKAALAGTVAVLAAGQDIPITELAITLVPAGGIKIGDTLPSAVTSETNVTLTTVWKLGTTTVTKAETAGDYTATITVTAKDGYVLTDTEYKLDGAPIELTQEVLTKTVTVTAAAPAEYDVTVNVEPTAGGTAVAQVDNKDVTKAAEGDSVTIKITPNSGYEVQSVTFDGNSVEWTNADTYTFEMPNVPVIVNVVFKQTQTSNPDTTVTENGTVSSTGDVSATVNPSTTDLNDKIAEAKKDDNKAVTFEVTVPEADEAKAETANVTLSKAAVKSVSDENLAVIVKTPVATVTVPAATMKDITSKADGTNVKMVIDKPKTADVPTDVTHVGGFDVRFEDSKGEVTVNKPLKLKMKVSTNASKVFVYLYKAGKAYFLDSATKQYDVVGGFVEFEVKHLSTYVAQAAKNDDATADKTPSVVTPLGLSIAKDTNGNHGLLTVTGTKANTPYLVQFKAGTSADATCMINVITATGTSFELYTTEPTATNSFVVEVWELKSADEPFVGKFGVANAVEPMVYGGKLFKAFGSGEEIK